MSTDDVDINHFPIDKGEIHLAIAKRFAASRFSKMTQDDIETPDVSFGKSASTHAGGGILILQVKEDLHVDLSGTRYSCWTLLYPERTWTPYMTPISGS
jgi:hypothetical protein